LPDKAARWRRSRRRCERFIRAGLEEVRRRSRWKNIVSRLRDRSQRGTIVTRGIWTVFAYWRKLCRFLGDSSTL